MLTASQVMKIKTLSAKGDVPSLILFAQKYSKPSIFSFCLFYTISSYIIKKCFLPSFVLTFALKTLIDCIITCIDIPFSEGLSSSVDVSPKFTVICVTQRWYEECDNILAFQFQSKTDLRCHGGRTRHLR